ncbi:MAG: TldD/PmbA family protein [Betaproteobacteria bacterium]
MKEAFFELADALAHEVHERETLLCALAGERSDFVRFNRARVRQPGSVEQRMVTLRLVRERRQASATLTVAGNGDDLAQARNALARLREALARLPEDPWLMIAETPRSTESVRRGTLPAAEDIAQQVTARAANRDFVGIYAAGTICRGFANSLGQKNWHECDTFNLDWSLHLDADRAVKARYAGFDWDSRAFEDRLEAATLELARLAIPRRAIEPGEYRAYLSPRALEEFVGMMSWGGFSARARATRQSPLLRMMHGAILSPLVTLTENARDGIAPEFQDEGFVKPAAVPLIEKGRLAEALVSPRSAREYGLTPNGADSGESPESLVMAPGNLPAADALAALDTGLYIDNMWYLNYSDRPAGRITGMTRFATFRVERGQIVAPVNAMRFDDSLYRMLGENLIDLTRERELLLDASTYEARSTRSMRLPGALLGALRFTL